MAVAVHVVLPGITKEQYDQVRSEVDWIGDPPDGGISHLTWWEGDECHSMDAWESEAHFEAFGRNRLGPGMAKLGIDVPVEPTFHSAHEVFAPEPARLT
jgi:hypothetical protein